MGRSANRPGQPLGGMGGRSVTTTQVIVEVANDPGSVTARVTQLYVEVIHGDTPVSGEELRATQVALEVIYGGGSITSESLRVSQVALEVIHPLTYQVGRDLALQWNVSPVSPSVQLNWAYLEVPAGTGTVAVGRDLQFIWDVAQGILSTNTATDGWESAPTPGNLLAAIDEPYLYDDTDYIYSPWNPASKKARIKLTYSSARPPDRSFPIYLRYRTRQYPPNVSLDTTLTVRLVQGASTVISSWVQILNDDYATFTRTLTTTEKALITDYTDLYLEFIAD